ncbi:MAG: LPS assembly lipoprotein LptE [Gammaproteobacteria bacterium]
MRIPSTAGTREPERSRFFHKLSVAVLAILLCGYGCGFHLRGSSPVALRFSGVFVESAGASQVAGQLQRQMQYNGVALMGKAALAEAVVTLRDERFERRVLSVDPRTGKVREYELAYRVDLMVADAKGHSLLAAQSIDLIRDFTFDETAALGKSDEEQLLRQEMVQDAAATVLRRLETIKAK